MSGREEQRAATANAGEDLYEAAVLDFLNKELAAAKKPGEQLDQSEEIHALVEDLLKQVITETDVQPESTQDLTLEAESPAVASVQEPTGLAAEDDLLSNLNRGLSQTYGEKDLWEGEEPAAEQPLADEAQIESQAPPSIETAEAVSSPKIEETPSPDLQQVFQKAPDRPLPSEQVAMPFGRRTAEKQKLPLAAAIAIGVLIIVGTGIYSLFSTKDSGQAKNTAPAIKVSTSDLTAEQSPTGVPSLKGEGRAENKPKTPRQAVDSAGGAKPVPGTDAHRSPGPVKEMQTSGFQPPMNRPAEKPATSTLPTVSDLVGEQAKAEDKVADASTVATPMLTARDQGPAQVPDRLNPSPASGNGITLNGAAEKASVQLAPSGAPKSAELAPVSKPMPVIPVQQKIVVPAVPIMQTSPTYPEVALRSRTAGLVVLDIQIDEKGRVTKATPVSGPPLLHQAAIAAVLQWRYKPASIDGVNVPSQSRVTINFNLNK